MRTANFLLYINAPTVEDIEAAVREIQAHDTAVITVERMDNNSEPTGQVIHRSVGYKRRGGR